VFNYIGIIKQTSSNLKCNVNELWTRAAAYIRIWNEDVE